MLDFWRYTICDVRVPVEKFIINILEIHLMILLIKLIIMFAVRHQVYTLQYRSKLNLLGISICVRFMQAELTRMYDFGNLLKDWFTYDSVLFGVRSRRFLCAIIQIVTLLLQSSDFQWFTNLWNWHYYKIDIFFIPCNIYLEII